MENIKNMTGNNIASFNVSFTDKLTMWEYPYNKSRVCYIGTSDWGLTYLHAFFRINTGNFIWKKNENLITKKVYLAHLNEIISGQIIDISYGK